jgi:hypothetical protein
VVEAGEVGALVYKGEVLTGYTKLTKFLKLRKFLSWLQGDSDAMF